MSVSLLLNTHSMTCVILAQNSLYQCYFYTIPNKHNVSQTISIGSPCLILEINIIENANPILDGEDAQEETREANI